MKKKRKVIPNVRTVQEIMTKSLIGEIEDFGDKYGYEDFPHEDVEFSLSLKIKNRVDLKGGRTKFMKVFEKEAKTLYDNGIVGFREFGFLSLLGVYFASYEDNILRNKDGSLCTQKDITDTFKISKPTASALMKYMVERNLIFEQPHDEKPNAKMYLLNPLIFYKGRLINRKKREKFKEIEDSIYSSWTKKEVDSFPEDVKSKINEAIIAILEINDFEDIEDEN